MSGLSPQIAGSADIPELVALIESAYRGDDSRAGWTTEADLLGGQRIDADMAAEMLAEPGSTVLLVRDESGAALGTVHLRDLGDRTAYFGTFAVSPRAQGRGVGKELMTYAEAFARDRIGAERMRMTVIDQRTELIAFYERRGYVQTGEREPFPYGEERFGLPRTDDLEFVVLVKELDPTPA